MRWHYFRDYPGYDEYGVYHDYTNPFLFSAVRWTVRLFAWSFWNSPALLTSYVLLAWLRKIAGGVKGWPMWAFAGGVIVVAIVIAWVMRRLHHKMRIKRTAGEWGWVVFWGIGFLYGFVLAALWWQTFFVMGLGWWKPGTTHAWMSWVAGVVVGLMIFWRNERAGRG
jgi:hypothetical protein